jgi:DNA modification methylase
MRQIVRASLPLGVGVVLDPFMGGGSTIGAALSLRYESIGVELDPTFLEIAKEGVPKLASLNGNGKANSERGTSEGATRQQKLALLAES